MSPNSLPGYSRNRILPCEAMALTLKSGGEFFRFGFCPGGAFSEVFFVHVSLRARMSQDPSPGMRVLGAPLLCSSNNDVRSPIIWVSFFSPRTLLEYPRGGWCQELAHSSWHGLGLLAFEVVCFLSFYFYVILQSRCFVFVWLCISLGSDLWPLLSHDQ